jgi:glycosyltransferase involved in cell wall biosynthesis
MKTPLITIIIPTFRRPQLVKRAIRSALRQTFQDFQVCIYDNASGDETADAVEEFVRRDSRVKYHCHPRNIGGSANFLYALEYVDTPYFSFLSDDDVLLPNFLETAMRGFDRHPDAAFSAGSVIIVNEEGKVLNVPMHHWEREGIFYPPEGLLKTIGSNAPIWTGIVFKRDLTNFVGGLDAETWIMDMDFVSRVASRFPYVASKEPSALYVDHELSGSARIRLSAYWPACLRGIQAISRDDMIPEELRDRFEVMQRLYISKVIFTMGVKALESGNVEIARAAAEILRSNFKQHIRGNAVLLMSGEGEAAEILRRILSTLLIVRRGLLSLTGRRSKLQARYGSFADELRNS